MPRLALSLFLFLLCSMVLPSISSAQDQGMATGALTSDRSHTGGAQTLEDILARQRGLAIDDSFRAGNTGNPEGAAALNAQLGTLGGVSDPELWRALRYGSADMRASAGGETAAVLVQDGGMRWLDFRAGPLRQYGGGLLLATLGVLALFFLLRGRIMIDGEKSGQTVTRFKAIERFGHWLLAGSFIVLGVTGILTLFGRVMIAPYLGKSTNAWLLVWGKWLHNSVAWAFILGLVMIFAMWVVHNVPNRSDLVWLRQFGGIIGKAHPPAKKFNAGQKMIFWSVVLFGSSISLTGISLLFPFEMPLFAASFDALNATGLPQMLGYGALPVELAPQEEMQLAQAWHAILAFVLMAIILAHIYIGSLGMEGAYDAMGSGEVDEAWARQHHSIWLEELKTPPQGETKAQTPAE
ncbi:formate dehydrogenase, gamma subunit [Roseobacter sp. SK209-2-6]|uniref:formate dehydrogenase subunit gamma n=1 Tax=Roseobacter sp. SK209-2-6 TaxID=388739 RepID=UPI0000F3D671|nr:formate dehydrogenase subunit gamma [Roseobacter sp. SK209-2-6]EBA15731.1 formate dehydrogenase, gamma subunit [Roseobacter sp. SK209-2-6]